MAGTQRGLSLLELLITLSIIATLTSLALPKYTDSVQRANRSQAKAALLQAAQWMERVATTSGVYPNVQTSPNFTFPANAFSPASASYLIALPPATATDNSYLLTATPQDRQRNDPCGILTLTHTGERGAQSLTGTPASADMVASCWNR